VRISAQLIDVETDQAFWAETYERDFQDLLLLQSEVAQAVAREIQVAISPEETARLASARPVDPEAYEAYLKGRMHWYKHTPQDVDRALQYFQLAEEKDPNFALAKLGMGYVWTYYASVGLEPPGEMGAKVEEALRKAREIDPTLAEAYEAEADYRFYFDWDWEGAEENYKRGIELKPNSADMRLYYWEFLVAMNRPQEAQVQIETCLELDPYNTYVQTAYGLFLLSTGRFDDAINQFQKVLKTEGDFGTAQLGLWTAYHHKGMHELALASVKDYYSKWGDEEMVEALEVGFAEEGYRGAMRMAAEKLVDRSELYDVLATQVAIFFAYAGEKQRTLDWLEKAFEERETGVVKLQVDPDWDGVRDDPRFQDLLRRMNLPEA
jgi:tetratricopeptide (TPR) repeat protein